MRDLHWFLLGMAQVAYGLHLINCRPLERKLGIPLCILGVTFIIVGQIGFYELLSRHFILLAVLFSIAILMICILIVISFQKK